MDPNGTNRNPRKRKRRVKRRVKIPVIGLAVVGVLLILAQILAGTVARPILERRTSDMLGTPVRIKSLSVNIFTGWARLSGITVGEKSALASGTAVTAEADIVIDAIECDVSLLALIRGKTVLQNVRIEGPNIAIIRAADGRTNLDPLIESVKAARTGKPGKPTIIDRLHVSHGRVTYVDRSAGADAYTARVEELTVNGEGVGRFAASVLDVRAGPISLRWGSGPAESDIRVASGSAPVVNRDAIVGVGTVVARIKAQDALAGRLTAESLEIDRPAVYVERNAAGRVNLTRLRSRPPASESIPAAPAAAAPMPWKIERLRVSEGTVVYADHSQGEPAYAMRAEHLAIVAHNLAPERAVHSAEQAIAVDAVLRSGDRYGTLAVRGWCGGLCRPVNAELETRIVQANIDQFPVKRGPAGDLRVGQGEARLISRITCRDDVLDGRQDLRIRGLQLKHTAPDRSVASLLGVPIGTLNVFLKVTEGRLYIEFPLQGTIDKPHVPFDKALQQTVAEGPRQMLQKVIGLPGDFLKKGVDLGQLIARPLDASLKKLFDPATWQVKKRPGTDEAPEKPKLFDPRRPAKEPKKEPPTTRGAPDKWRLLDPKTWGRGREDQGTTTRPKPEKPSLFRRRAPETRPGGTGRG